MASKRKALKFENWGQYTRAARDYIPRALGCADEAPWTQVTLANVLGVESNYLAQVERGREPGRQYKLTLSYVVKMAQSGLDPREISDFLLTSDYYLGIVKPSRSTITSDKQSTKRR